LYECPIANGAFLLYYIGVRFAVQASPHRSHTVRRLRSLAQAGAAFVARFAPDCIGGRATPELLPTH
jgi:hypothetical protein